MRSQDYRYIDILSDHDDEYLISLITSGFFKFNFKIFIYNNKLFIKKKLKKKKI